MRRLQRGFTLIELLIVVGILGILVAVPIPKLPFDIPFFEHVEERLEEAAAAELEAVQMAVVVMMYENDLSTLPNPVDTTATNDMTAFPDPAYPLYPVYIAQPTTTGTYTCTAEGVVTQVTTGYETG